MTKSSQISIFVLTLLAGCDNKPWDAWNADTWWPEEMSKSKQIGVIIDVPADEGPLDLRNERHKKQLDDAAVRVGVTLPSEPFRPVELRASGIPIEFPSACGPVPVACTDNCLHAACVQGTENPAITRVLVPAGANFDRFFETRCEVAKSVCSEKLAECVDCRKDRYSDSRCLEIQLMCGLCHVCDEKRASGAP